MTRDQKIQDLDTSISFIKNSMNIIEILMRQAPTTPEDDYFPYAKGAFCSLHDALEDVLMIERIVTRSE